MLSQGLATRSNLKRRHMTVDDQCRRCRTHAETDEHLFFECIYAKSVWRASGVSNNIIHCSITAFEEKIAECLRCNSSENLTHLQDLPIPILCRIRKSLNLLLFQRKHIF